MADDKSATKKVGIPTKSKTKKVVPKAPSGFGPGGGGAKPRHGGKVAGVGRGSCPPPSKG